MEAQEEMGRDNLKNMDSRLKDIRLAAEDALKAVAALSEGPLGGGPGFPGGIHAELDLDRPCGAALRIRCGGQDCGAPRQRGLPDMETRGVEAAQLEAIRKMLETGKDSLGTPQNESFRAPDAGDVGGCAARACPEADEEVSRPDGADAQVPCLGGNLMDAVEKSVRCLRIQPSGELSGKPEASSVLDTPLEANAGIEAAVDGPREEEQTNGEAGRGQMDLATDPVCQRFRIRQDTAVRELRRTAPARSIPERTGAPGSEGRQDTADCASAPDEERPQASEVLNVCMSEDSVGIEVARKAPFRDVGAV